MKKHNGFTLIEMLAVIAVMAILASIAMPSFLYRIVRNQITLALPLADLAKKPTEAAWLAALPFPANNTEANLPPAEKIVSSYISAVNVENGVVNITFGNQANNAIKGKILSLRPAVVEGTHLVPVSWICASAPVPAQMTVLGEDKTTIAADFLPNQCRAKSN
ncbi:pilin [Undibacterium sp. Dicai25W]|uniref:pilin n=1 Tax=Undibacterium sp. Dicai25W TaxID=3413034 RepID=UPI003BF14377